MGRGMGRMAVCDCAVGGARWGVGMGMGGVLGGEGMDCDGVSGCGFRCGYGGARYVCRVACLSTVGWAWRGWKDGPGLEAFETAGVVSREALGC